MSGFRPLGIGEVLGFSWSLYRGRFGTLIAISAALVGIPSLLQWVPGVGWLMEIGLFLTELLATGALIRVTASQCADLHTSATEATRAAGSRFGKMLGMLGLLVLGVVAVGTVMIMIGTMILALVAPGMLEQLNLYANDPFAAPLGTLLPFLVWTFVMVLPALALMVLWWLAPMVVMVEGEKATTSLRRSWQLVSARFARVLAVLLLSLLLVVLAFLVLNWLLPEYWATLIIGILTLPFSTVIGTVLYLDLRARAEDLSPEILARELTSSA